MAAYVGKYLKQKNAAGRKLPRILIPVSLLLVELFSFCYLQGTAVKQYWPLAFGAIWALMLASLLLLLPPKASRMFYGAVYLGALIYAVGQTGYYRLFGDMMWLSDFRYASEGADYLNVLLQYPAHWYACILCLLALGTAVVLRYPQNRSGAGKRWMMAAFAAVCALEAFLLPQAVFSQDKDIQYAGSNFGRSRSSQAAYENMFNPHRLYQVCGLYQMAAKDLWQNSLSAMMPGYARLQEKAEKKIESYCAEDPATSGNAMTGILEDKHVILVLMESLDDWMLGDHTPTLNRLMEEGINFTNFYTPSYGGIRTFNTEFCINTGSYLSSRGGYALDFVSNSYDHSLANLLGELGYSAKLYHYNDPTFYSRDVFSAALGYEEYVCYGDYLTESTERERKQLLYDDLLLFKNPGLRQSFFREEEKTFNFVITRSAHLSYKYNEVLSYWAMKKYPEYRGMTQSEEMDCAYVKARLVDDFFQWLLMELEEEGKLHNTVIIGVTDHYTYGYKNTEELLELSGVEQTLLLEKTPCFIWSENLMPMTVDKVLNTADLLPTVLNLLGVKPEYSYIGRDAFDESYKGFVPFSNGSWITEEAAYDAAAGKVIVPAGKPEPSEEYCQQMDEQVRSFVEINNLILETDYYQQTGHPEQ